MIRSATLTLTAVALVAACGHHHDHGEGHDHGDGETPSTSFTRWTATHEIFAEHDVLVVGAAAGSAIHVTLLDGHRAAEAGALTFELRQKDGTLVTGRAEAPARAGIYQPTLTPTVAGPCTLTVRYAGPPATEAATEDCQVYPNAQAIPAEEEEPAGRIAYLKEQAWGTGFSTALVAARPIVRTLRATGELRPVTGRQAQLAAPVAGRIELAPGLALGAVVERGQLLAELIPTVDAGANRAVLAADSQGAAAELAAATAQLGRAERLWAARAIPERQLDDARTQVALARAKVAAVRGRLAQYDASAGGRGAAGRIALRAPRAGRIADLAAISGAAVDAGAPLVTIVDGERLWLHADVYEPDVAAAAAATGASFTVDGVAAPIAIAPPDGRLVSVGAAVDEATRTVPVVFEFANPGGLRVGSFASVELHLGVAREVLAVPETALLRDAGRWVAYVQLEGEAFERRLIEPGERAGGWVEIVGGLAAGDRVVTAGAYQVKLAAAGGAVPGHGHAH